MTVPKTIALYNCADQQAIFCNGIAQFACSVVFIGYTNIQKV